MQQKKNQNEGEMDAWYSENHKSKKEFYEKNYYLHTYINICTYLHIHGTRMYIHITIKVYKNESCLEHDKIINFIGYSMTG